MKEETSEHVQQSVKAFGWLIFPLCLAFFLGSQFGFGQNTLSSTLWGVAVYFYSSFLPDLPSVYRRKSSENRTGHLPAYKKYAILLFAPLLIWLLFFGVRLRWRTSDTFHNFRSLVVYGAFLFAVGFLAFVSLPFSVRDFVQVLFFLFCGVAGFLAHLKVDHIW